MSSDKASSSSAENDQQYSPRPTATVVTNTNTNNTGTNYSIVSNELILRQIATMGAAQAYNQMPTVTTTALDANNHLRIQIAVSPDPLNIGLNMLLPYLTNLQQQQVRGGLQIASSTSTSVSATPNQPAAERVCARSASVFPTHTSRAEATASFPSSSYRAITGTNATTNTHKTGTGICLALDQDESELSPYQCLARKNIELFEQPDDDGSTKEHTCQGRNRPVVPGQVGIRCRHCGSVPPRIRAKGAVLFPSTLLGIYQAAQNMTNTHLVKTCKLIPDAIRHELIRIQCRENGKRTRKSAYGGGKQYWADSAKVLGVVETDNKRLKFVKSAATATDTSRRFSTTDNTENLIVEV